MTLFSSWWWSSLQAVGAATGGRRAALVHGHGGAAGAGSEQTERGGGSGGGGGAGPLVQSLVLALRPHAGPGLDGSVPAEARLGPPLQERGAGVSAGRVRLT